MLKRAGYIAIPKQQGLAALGRAMAKMAMPQAKMKNEGHDVIENKTSADGGTGVSPVWGHGQGWPCHMQK